MNSPTKDLFTACRAGNLEVVRGAVRRGANVNEAIPRDDNDTYSDIGYYGETPLHAAIGNSMSWADSILVNGARIAALNTPPSGMSLIRRRGQTMPSDEVLANIIAIVKFLIENGANVNPKTEFARQTPLENAAEFGNVELVATLIDLGAAVKAPDYHKSALHHASYGDYPELLAYLIKHADPADINTVDGQKFTPLSMAAFGGSISCVELLLEAGAEISICDHFGHTALHKVCYAGDGKTAVEIAKRLIAAGADLGAKDERGNTPHSLAKKLDCSPELVAILRPSQVAANL